jgi:2-amino-4-hydroxy-6-hydroxymethyldihydropteridine diphosphokinase
MAKAIIALGGNLGDRRAMIERAIARLEQCVGRCVRRSDLIETAAWIHPDDDADWHPPFLNGVAVFETRRAPHDILERLLAIEAELGRARRADAKPWQPRLIDLDLIAVDDAVVATSELTLPHPRMHERDFVLKPLLSIMPNWRHPILRMTVRELLGRLNAQASRRR